MVPCAAHLHPGTAVVVGGMVLDVTASPGPHARLRAGSSTPGAVRQNPGGVARNIAEGSRVSSATPARRRCSSPRWATTSRAAH